MMEWWWRWEEKGEQRGLMAHACSGVVCGFPEVWLDAEGEIRI